MLNGVQPSLHSRFTHKPTKNTAREHLIASAPNETTFIPLFGTHPTHGFDPKALLKPKELFAPIQRAAKFGISHQFTQIHTQTSKNKDQTAELPLNFKSLLVYPSQTSQKLHFFLTNSSHHYLLKAYNKSNPSNR